MSIILSNNNAPFQVECENKPVILIDVSTYARIQKIVELSPQEVSWFSYVEKVQDQLFKIKDAYIIEQKVSGAETEMTTEGLSNFMVETIKTKGKDYYKNIRCWGHSHVNMSTSPSAQDVKQIGEFNNGDFYIMLIFNKRGDIYSEIRDFKNGFRYKGVPVVLEQSIELNSESIKEELKQKVSEQRYDTRYVVGGENTVRTIEKYMSPTPAITSLTEQISFLNNNEAFIDEEDEIGFPSEELVTIVFNNAKAIVENINSLLKLTQYATRSFNIDEIIEMYMTGHIQAYVFDHISVTQSPNVVVSGPVNEACRKISLFLKEKNSELSEIIAYMETYDQDLNPNEYDTAEEYYAEYMAMFEDEELDEDDEDDEDLISDDPIKVNEAIINKIDNGGNK